MDATLTVDDRGDVEIVNAVLPAIGFSVRR